jgi:hypothetical protein
MGTLFARGLDPDQLAALGAQYTGHDDIVTLVEPVIMAPLRREWEDLRSRRRESALTSGPASRKATKLTDGANSRPRLEFGHYGGLALGERASVLSGGSSLEQGLAGGGGVAGGKGHRMVG